LGSIPITKDYVLAVLSFAAPDAVQWDIPFFFPSVVRAIPYSEVEWQHQPLHRFL
jgi:hypothetical protein